jgi:hypothetical protein
VLGGGAVGDAIASVANGVMSRTAFISGLLKSQLLFSAKNNVEPTDFQTGPAFLVFSGLG